jgi:ferredoxin
MKAIVDAEACVGCGLCADTCPAVFAMEGEVAKAIVATVPPDEVDACNKAAENCPVNAITVEY